MPIVPKYERYFNDEQWACVVAARVVRAYEEWFAGYFEDPGEYLHRTFEEVAGYDEMVLLRDIRFESHCEHHIAPIIGRVHIGYLPRRRVVGISKLVRLVDVFASYKYNDNVSANFAIDNLFDRRYRAFLDSANSPGLAAKFSLTVKLAGK